MKKAIIVGWMAFLVSGCTYNVSMAHTEGAAEDVIDDNQSPTNTISPRISMPLVGK